MYNNKKNWRLVISTKLTTLPGFCDVHVHLREPGFSQKETIRSGTKAAAHGGYTDICAMPNLNPVPDCKKNLDIEQNIINKKALINVYPYASITLNQKGKKLTNMKEVNAIAYSDDGNGVQDSKLMNKAMSQKKLIAAHCEFNNESDPKVAEWKMVERDLYLAASTGCKYHVCHVSCRQSVDLIRAAKKDGINVTCETAPHYLVLCKEEIPNKYNYKMNPPIHYSADRNALLEGIIDGTIDIIATDHAPHTKKDKINGANGITGIELAFPVLYTKLVKENIISLKMLTKLMSKNPRKRFKIPEQKNTYSLWNLNEKFVVKPKDLLSKGKSTPFEGWELYGVNYKTVLRGKTVWQKEKI